MIAFALTPAAMRRLVKVCRHSCRPIGSSPARRHEVVAADAEDGGCLVSLDELARRVGLEPLLTIDELRTLANVSRRTVERAIADGRVRVVHLSPRSVRIPQSAAAAYLAGATEPAERVGKVRVLTDLEQGGDRDR